MRRINKVVQIPTNFDRDTIAASMELAKVSGMNSPVDIFREGVTETCAEVLGSGDYAACLDKEIAALTLAEDMDQFSYRATVNLLDDFAIPTTAATIKTVVRYPMESALDAQAAAAACGLETDDFVARAVRRYTLLFDLNDIPDLSSPGQ